VRAKIKNTRSSSSSSLCPSPFRGTLLERFLFYKSQTNRDKTKYTATRSRFARSICAHARTNCIYDSNQYPTIIRGRPCDKKERNASAFRIETARSVNKNAFFGQIKSEQKIGKKKLPLFLPRWNERVLI
jgi:hypothetical protein